MFLGDNGYYPNGDTTQPLTKEGVTYSTESATAPTIGDCTVVTDITVPLDGISQTYVSKRISLCGCHEEPERRGFRRKL